MCHCHTCRVVVEVGWIEGVEEGEDDGCWVGLDDGVEEGVDVGRLVVGTVGGIGAV